MAKKSKSVRPVSDGKPGANPYQKNRTGQNIGKVLGAACLLAFIIFDQLWIGILTCTLVFSALYIIQVFFEKSKSWYSSMFLYAALATALLAYLEYSSGVITRLMTFK